MVTDMLYSSVRVDLHRRIALAPHAFRGSRHPETPVCDVEDAAGSPASSRDCAASPHPASQAMRERAHEGAGGRRSRHDSIDVNRGAGNSLF
jgi:hypothetical protein